MTTKNNEHCRLPQRSDGVSGVECVVGLTPICAVPDAARELAVENVIADEAEAIRLHRCSPKVKKGP